MLQRSLLGLLFVSLCVRCMPNLDGLTSGNNAAGAGGTALGQGGTSSGGSAGGGRGGAGGSLGGDAGSGVGGTMVVAGDGGQSGANDAGNAGVNEAGSGGGGQGGVGGAGGSSGKGGKGGSTAGRSTGGMSAGGTSTAGTSTGGIVGEGGAAGAGPDLPCVDGCAILYVPSYANFSQFFTINIDLNTGVDLSDSVLTAHLRTIDFTGTTENIQFYASALPNFNFYNNNNVQVPLSSLTAGGTLTMDLTTTGSWDHTKVITVGFLLHGATTGSVIQVLIEDVSIAVKADPQGTPLAGPWLFTMQTDVNETNAESIPSTYADSNVLFANPYNPVPGAKAIWVAPAAAGAGGSP